MAKKYGPSFKAIKTTHPIVRASRAKILGAMIAFKIETLSVFKKYPTAVTSYVRTGELGKRWTGTGPSAAGTSIVVIVGNNVPYAKSVMGFWTREPKQGQVWLHLGWPSVEITAKVLWPKYRTAIIDALHQKASP